MGFDQGVREVLLVGCAVEEGRRDIGKSAMQILKKCEGETGIPRIGEK
ncbi:MAG: hypothetical protein ABIH78_02085 [Candidatus Peregrinibacteria bacterium]